MDTNTTYPLATASNDGLMAKGDKGKLDGIAVGAEVNQNAFGNILVGSTTIAADTKTDTLTFVAGTNVTLTPDAANDKLTIAAKDTTYAAATQSVAGLMSAADIKCVAETMGHKNITMLLSVYQHTLFEQRRRAVNAAPGLFSGTGAKRGKKKRLPPGRGKEASAFFEPAPERRAAPPHDAAASWGVAACVCAGTRAADRTDAGTPDARQPDGSGAR